MGANERLVDNLHGDDAHQLQSATMHPFQVMAEPVRRRIVDILASGEHTSGELADVISTEFSISATAVSKHLRRMLDAGFVDVRADWSNRVYRLSDDAIAMLEDEVADLRRKYDERIGWSGKGDPTKAGVALKGVGRPGRRGRRGKGFAGDPWRAWLNPTPFGTEARIIDQPPAPVTEHLRQGASLELAASSGEKTAGKGSDLVDTWDIVDGLERDRDSG
jgi:DNA-binding transcriptional ArsR family regulator